MNTPPCSVDIGICTFRRQSITTTLASLKMMEEVEGCTVRIIVADNDVTPTAQLTVAKAAEEFELNIHYVHAPAQNISIARNACLDAATADFFAFIDDDEVVANSWLKEMLKLAVETEAAATLGPVFAIYNPDIAGWIRYGDFHTTKPVWVNGKIITGYAGNVMLRRKHPALQGLRFKLELGISGGEDTDFFAQLHEAGGRIVYAEKAVAYEPVPENRANLKWLRNRRLRFGETHAEGLLKAGKNPQTEILRATVKAAICYAMVPLTIAYPAAGMKWLLRGSLHQGVIRRLKQERKP